MYVKNIATEHITKVVTNYWIT